MTGLAAVESEGSVSRDASTGVAIVRAPRPLHYYSLFSQTIGADVIVSVYPGQHYEVEAKYTQYIRLHSRPVFPRLHMLPLAKVGPLI